MDVFSCLLVLLFLSPVSGLILPVTKPNGEPDLSSLISHVTLIEQTMTNLQTQVQTTNSKLQATAIELTTVKDKLQTTEDELKVVKSDLKSAETDIAILKHEFQKGPDPVELTNMKSEFEALKISYNSLVQQVNFTVIDSVSSDVKSNRKEIQSLKNRQNTTEKHEIAALSVLQAVQNNMSTISGDVNSLSQQVSVVKNQIEADRSKQNITEQNLTATKILVQSTSAEVKSIKSQVNTASGDVNAVTNELASIKNRTDEDVAFQVTQTARNSSTGWTTLKFDTVDYNTGGGYSNASGMFTAPVSGTYIFWANVVYNSPVTWFHINIYKGQQALARGFYWKADDDWGGGASTMTVTHLDKGDQVHFTTDKTSNYIDGSGYSSYGGALLHAI